MAGPGSTRGSTRSSTTGNSGFGSNRGPRHGHGNKGKGGGGAYGNPTGRTISEAMKIYGVSDAASLQQRMSYNPAETHSFYSLIDDSATTDDTTTTDNTNTNTTDNTTTGNNNVTTTTTLDLDNLYATILGRGPDVLGGGTIQKSARDYWNKQFTDAGSDEAALQSVISGIQGSQEFKDLGVAADTYLTNPNLAAFRTAASKSIDRGDGVNAGTIASYSDKFNTDGTVKSDWVDTETWSSNKMQLLMDEIADLKANPIVKTVTNTVPADTSMYDQQIADLQSALDSTQVDYDSLMATYKDQKIGYDSLLAQAAYGDKPGNLTVKGVKTQNELPGYQTKTSGTGFFNRDKKKDYTSGPLASTLKIGGLNLA